jgi:uncharacterized small protein (DUF1192 family)
MAKKAVCAILVCLAPFLGAQPPGELERTAKTLQSLTELKTRVQEIEAEIDRLLKELSEQKGKLEAQPAPQGKPWSNIADIQPDRKPVAVRCAAITSKGARCTRPAVEGSRYCKQHQLAHAK